MVDAMGVVRLLGKQQPDKMRTYKLRPITETAEQARAAKGQKGKIAKQIVLGIDAHLKSYQVCRKIDAGGLQPVQSFSLEKLLLFGYKQLQLAEKVYAVYEAGPLGYVLYRKLRELGIEAQVCAPECLEAGSKRKHNKIDASKLAGRLYSYLGGDRYGLRMVRVPSPAQEQLRARSRQHDQLVRTRKALAAQGRSLLLSQGYSTKGSWWRPGAFSQLRALIPEWISQELALWQANLGLLDQQIGQLKTELAQSLQGPRPKGAGALSLAQVDREVFDYQRFPNARSVGCFGGLCPSEHSTGDPSKQRLGSITKVGNPRIRVLLVEMAWRLVKFQPQYQPIQKWSQALTGPNRALKKKAIVAVARRLLIDIWRIRTGRTTAQALGLVLSD
jgi:transposase